MGELRALPALLLLLSCASGPGFVCPEGTRVQWSTQQTHPELPDLPASRLAACATLDGTPHGPFAKWMGDRLLSVGHHVGGELHGTLMAWGEHGRRMQMAEYAEGRQVRVVGWNPAGARTYEEVWQDDGRSVVTLWYDDGALRTRTESRGEEFDGAYESWYASGALRASGRYAGGQRVGSWTCWDPSGEQSLTTVYDEAGVLVSEHGDAQLEAWSRTCVLGCPGERIDAIASLSPQRRCGAGDASAPAAPDPS